MVEDDRPAHGYVHVDEDDRPAHGYVHEDEDEPTSERARGRTDRVVRRLDRERFATHTTNGIQRVAQRSLGGSRGQLRPKHCVRLRREYAWLTQLELHLARSRLATNTVVPNEV